jgi:hypothetical protein
MGAVFGHSTETAREGPRPHRGTGDDLFTITAVNPARNVDGNVRIEASHHWQMDAQEIRQRPSPS